MVMKRVVASSVDYKGAAISSYNSSILTVSTALHKVHLTEGANPFPKNGIVRVGIVACNFDMVATTKHVPEAISGHTFSKSAITRFRRTHQLLTRKVDVFELHEFRNACLELM
jgi:hypothetical protein